MDDFPLSHALLLLFVEFIMLLLLLADRSIAANSSSIEGILAVNIDAEDDEDRLMIVQQW